jgi:hypothetical protein
MPDLGQYRRWLWSEIDVEKRRSFWPFSSVTLYAPSANYKISMGSGAADNITALMGSVADLLRRDHKQSEYGRVVMPLTEGDVTISAIFSDKGKQHEAEHEQLSGIFETLNEEFGTNLNERDQLLLDQFEETWFADPEVMAQARNNEFENFRLVFDRMFMGTVVARMDDNEEIFIRVLDDPEFQRTPMDLYAVRADRRLREAGPPT